ncbi:pantothenate kinase 1 isoform X5 [Apium graveolens]|uniref:pantothenate kinase 1 isoform X5 n=1 Tax=Apium graveolens TaxID=4045 RepID=UPI003D797502
MEEWNQSANLALDIGGTLIKMVYFSSTDNCSADSQENRSLEESNDISDDLEICLIGKGRLHFVKFETTNINDCLDFISSNQLSTHGDLPDEKQHSAGDRNLIKATGGGAFKFADLFMERLGLNLDKVDEMDCLVAGANFLLKAINQEAFTYMNGHKKYLQIDHNDMYPYLLVNIGSGVSMIKVEGDEKFERVSGTSVGGGTFWGLGKLLTNCKSFDELLKLSQEGNNRVIDMLVGDIYGGLDYSKISYLNALRFGLKRIFFGGFFIRGHEFTMDTISVAVDFWSKGEAKAMFLRHEGFLGALGAYTSYQKKNSGELISHQLIEQLPNGVQCTGDDQCRGLPADPKS